METAMFNHISDVARHRCTIVCLIAVLLAAGCGGRQTLDSPSASGPAAYTALAGTPVQEISSRGPAFPKLPSIAAVPGTFLYDRSGADYAVDLGYANIQVESKRCMFSPGQDTQNTLAGASYCVYRMRCYREAESAALSFKWDTTAPDNGACWIGLPDWEKGCWQWQLLSESNSIDLDPATTANEFHQVFVAVVVAGGHPAWLESVRMECNPDGMVEYTLFPPQAGFGTFLLDREQNTAKRWISACYVNSSAYLLSNGHMLRTCFSEEEGKLNGRLELYDWDLNLVWYYQDFPDAFETHHDIAPMPNGNILAIVVESINTSEAIEAGIDPIPFSGILNIDAIVEVEPQEGNTGEIVWTWRLFDHLIQDFDQDKSNYGIVGEHPELLDINFDSSGGKDFSHANSIAYNPELDQILINLRSEDEFYIIDHSTTTEEAAGHTGGRYGRGGDFLYRWGNPAVYQQGDASDQQLFKQHDAEWISPGCPGEGNIIVFDNGVGRPVTGPLYSTIVELQPPLQADGTYAYNGGAFGPDAPVWIYTANPPASVYTSVMGGVQRLPNGNTLLCVAQTGVLLEVTPEGETVWEYKNTHPYPSSNNPVFKAERYYLFGPDFPVEQ